MTANYEDLHLMVVLIGERPEEVTDMDRSVEAEVISSTFDEPVQNHVRVAEMALEQANALLVGSRECGYLAGQHHPPHPSLQLDGTAVGPHVIRWY
ncbi:MAG: hypothetical protein R2856_31975 [Caldilineaceae bacterium]